MRGWLFLSLICTGSLLAVTGLRQFFIEPLGTSSSNSVWFLIQVLPLLLPLPGALRGQLRSMFLLCLVSSLYFIHAVLVINDEPLFLIASAEVLFSLGLAVCTAVFVRKRRELDAASGPDTPSEP
ncbi:MAG: DUF2069 domain-containing protein [Proteobacteria bacterium]|nr:DUF2069 domain-containing protein [Pseudomonadota bacterium]